MLNHIKVLCVSSTCVGRDTACRAHDEQGGYDCGEARRRLGHALTLQLAQVITSVNILFKRRLIQQVEYQKTKNR